MTAFNRHWHTIAFLTFAIVCEATVWREGLAQSAEHEDLKAASLKAEEGKDLGAAVLYLQKYLSQSPQDYKAKLHLGMLCADAAYTQAAYDNLNDVVRTADKSLSADDLRKARRKLIDTAIVLGRYPEAATHVKILAADSPNDGELAELLGTILIYSNKNDEACRQFRRAIKLAPERVASYIRLALVLRSRLGKPADADAVMEEMISVPANAKSVDANAKYAYYYLERGKSDVALDKAMKILALVPDDSKGLFLAGRCFMAKQDYAKAEVYLLNGIQAVKDDRAMYMVLAEVQNQLHKSKEAIATLKKGLDATRGTRGCIEILWDLANAQIVAGEIAEAKEDLKQLRTEGYPPQLTDFLDARLAIQQQDWTRAESLLKDSVIPRTEETPGVRRLAWVYLAQCYHQKGSEWSERDEVEAYEQALKVDPTMYTAHAGLADIYVSQHKLEEAAQQYRLALKSPQRTDAMIGLVRVLIAQQLRIDQEKRDWRPVDELLDELLANKQVRPGTVVLKAEVLLAKAREASAESASEDAAPELRRQFDAYVNQAASLLKQCTDKVPKNSEGWLARIRLAMYLAGQETDPAKKADLWSTAAVRVNEAEQSLGDGVPVRMARGSLAVRSNDPRAVEVLKGLGENISALSDVEKMQLWGVLATLAVQANDLDIARAYCRLVAEKEPKNIRIRLLLCELDLRTNEKSGNEKSSNEKSGNEKSGTVDLPELDRLVNEIEQLAGQGPYWLYAKAIRCVIQSKGKDPRLLLEARGYLHDAIEMRPNWAALAVLSGKIREFQDEPDQALDFYIAAIYSMNERDNEVIRRAVELLGSRGRFGEARQLVDFMEKQKGSQLGETQPEFAYAKIFKGEIAAAESEVDKFASADSSNYKDVAWQGQMYGYLVHRLKVQAIQRQADKSTDEWKSDVAMLRMAQKSVNALLRAHKLNPQSDEVTLSLVRLLIEVDRPEKAAPLIADMERTLKGEKAMITIGYCYELLHETAKAQEKYEAAVKAAPQNGRVLRQAAGFYLRSDKFALAESLLRTIISLEQSINLSDLCWARRNLAIVLKSRGDFEDLTKAIALVDENLRSKAAALDDKRMKVDLLLVDPRREKNSEAIAAMEEIVKTADATVNDNFALAQLYLKSGNQAAYDQEMDIVLKGSGLQPRHIVFYVNSLLKRKDFAGADPWLQVLEKSMPDSMDTTRLRAEYFFGRGDFKAAGDLAMNYLDKSVGNRGQQVYDVAALIEGFVGRLKADNKQAAAADLEAKTEQLFRALRSKKLAADGDLVYANYLARQKRIKESLDVLEQSSDTHRFDLVRMAVTSILASRAATAEQCAQLEKIVSDVSTKSNRPCDLLATLAILHGHQKRFDKAQADLREILAKEPRNFQALNNLGISLARHGGNLDEALKLVDQALVVSGPLEAVLDSRAIVYIARKEPEKALEDLRAAIGGDGNAELYFHQAWAYSLVGQKTEAAAAFASARKKSIDSKNLDPDEIAVYERLAKELQK